VVEASHFASAVLPVVSSLPAPAGGVAVVPAPGGLRAVVCAEAAGARSAEVLAASEQAHFGLAQADCLVATQAVDSVPTGYSVAPQADDLVPADLPQDDCSAAPRAVDLVRADYSPVVDLAPADLPLDDCLVEAQAIDSVPVAQRADDLVLADYSAAVGSVADERSAVVDLAPAGCLAGPQAVDLVPADYSAEVGSVAGDCSAARKADDHSAPAALDDCSRVVDLVPADLAPAGCLAGPQAADSAPVDYSAAQPAVGLTAREYLRPERAGCPGGSRAGYSGGPCSASQAFPEAPS
jgi:hypothetical protein